MLTSWNLVSYDDRAVPLTCSMKYDEPISSMRAAFHPDWPSDRPVFTLEHTKSRLVSTVSLVTCMRPLQAIMAEAHDTHCLR
jgi:hypothetical protein